MNLIRRLYRALKERRRIAKLRRRYAFASFETLEQLARMGVLDPGDFRVLCGAER